jgi:hypothetical protein
MSKWVMRAHFRYLCSDKFSNDIRNSLIQWVLTPAITLCGFENPSRLHSQNGSSLGNVEVYSLTLSHTPGSMKCDFRPSPLACIFVSPCRGREPNARVATPWPCKREMIKRLLVALVPKPNVNGIS